ncbi:MAG: hypothetical protein ACJAQ2_002232 [Vicingaceae bacterium]|jgi:hypothetical protein
MNYLIVILLVLSFNANSQTGSLICDIDFGYYNEEFDTYSLKLTSKKETLYFNNIENHDTLRGIEQGKYQATFYCCDSAYIFKYPISIDGNAVNKVDYYGSFEMRSDRPRNDTPSYHYNQYNRSQGLGNWGYQFGRGTKELEAPSNIQQNYQIRMFGGSDYILGKSPIGLGFEFGLEYNRILLNNLDIANPSITHQRQRMTYFNFSTAYVTSIYIKKKKILDFGISYHLPLRAKVVQVNGNQKSYTKNIHNFNDLRLFAHAGFMCGFVFAEYRTVRFIKAPFDDLPKLNLGLRFNVPSSFYN